jgi:hypothetical protein
MRFLWWGKKKQGAAEAEPRRRPPRDEVKDLRAKLTGEGYTLKH